jgi:hypothetical protein
MLEYCGSAAENGVQRPRSAPDGVLPGPPAACPAAFRAYF